MRKHAGWTLALVGLLVAAIARGVNAPRTRALEHEHAVLVDEIGRARARLIPLDDSLRALAWSAQQLRLVAGLNVLDSTVQQPAILAASLEEIRPLLASRTPHPDVPLSLFLASGHISSPFTTERLDPVLHELRPHWGVDVAAPAGSPIAAPAAGVVVDVTWDEGFGNLVTISHGYGVVTRFAHCAKILVSRGERVERGQTFALVGSTGESTGPHVHYEVWVNGRPVDPRRFVLSEYAIGE